MPGSAAGRGSTGRRCGGGRRLGSPPCSSATAGAPGARARRGGHRPLLDAGAGPAALSPCCASCAGISGARGYVATQPAIETVSLPAYAPELNPDERVWGHVKCRRLADYAAADTAAQRR
ncbi:MAG TPA: transposase [Thermodesulfobacteriota bacterium]